MSIEADRDSAFKILYPHWGYEMQLYPNPEQIAFGKELLSKWDMIVGHHSHCPQPISRYADKSLAYSLGDFSCSFIREQFHYGMCVEVEVGPNTQGIWQTGWVEWKFTKQESNDRNTVSVDVVNTCRFFPSAG